MSHCAHPTAALYVDKQRGTTHCTLCGDIVVNDQFELDPVFAKGPTQSNTRASRNHKGGGGAIRPRTGIIGGSTSHARPNIETARRDMLQIARELEMNEDIVEVALGIYKTALSVNAIAGHRSAILCACLYAACRREHTPHMIYDFVECRHDSASAILSNLKVICEATHTEIPVVDPSCLIQRFAEQLDLGERTDDVILCALKVLRVMQQDWIACGRRPMGVCAAALLVGCYVCNVQRTPDQVCGMVRLTANTIAERLHEFSKTPAAALASIDDYRPSDDTLPPAFGANSMLPTEEDVGAAMRELSSVYYELVAEAKMSSPATEARCLKWRTFIQKHCELQGFVPSEDNLDLNVLTAEAQLHILGLPHTKPIPRERVEQSIKDEEEKILVKREESAMDPASGGGGGTHRQLDHTLHGSLSNRGIASGVPGADLYNPGTFPRAPLDDFSLSDPEQLQNITEQYRLLLTGNEEIQGLRDDFDLADVEPTDGVGAALGGYHFGQSTQNQFSMPDTAASTHSQLGHLSPAPQTPGQLSLIGEERQIALEDLLRDKERRHALPWEFVVLQDIDLDDAQDLLPYLVLDNEERLRRFRLGEQLYKDNWNRGKAKTREEIELLEESRVHRKRRRQVIAQPTTVPTALDRALRGRGAGTITVSNISELIPELSELDGDGAGDDIHMDWE